MMIMGGREKYNLVPHFIFVSIAPPISFKLLILCDSVHAKNSMLTLNLRAFFYFSP